MGIIEFIGFDDKCKASSLEKRICLILY
jgi:hypothetical protein